jgi:hypothetical protein
MSEWQMFWFILIASSLATFALNYWRTGQVLGDA